MNRGFTTLEAFLIGLFCFFVFIIAGIFGLPLFNHTQYNLEQRYDKYVSLLNEKKYSEAYSYLSSSEKNQLSLGDFQDELTRYKKQIISINKIVIKNNVAYIDRNNTLCEDVNCDIKKEIRGYKKWVFENGNWYYSSEYKGCIRDNPYPKPSEFDRALSLIGQRWDETYGNGDVFLKNCFDIQYASLDNEEGYFTFDKNNSNLDRLKIYVDNSYKIKDDILTAYLLMHEIDHASQYVLEINGGDVKDCFEDEIQAFKAQKFFLYALNESEKDSILARINTANISNNNPLIMIRTFLEYSTYAMRVCGSDGDCTAEKIDEQIASMVYNSPYYKQQCLQN